MSLHVVTHRNEHGAFESSYDETSRLAPPPARRPHPHPDPEPLHLPPYTCRYIPPRQASSIERAQAAAGAAGAHAGPFQTVDEHGYSLSEYGALLRKMVSANTDPSIVPVMASELQMQHQEVRL